MIFLPYITFKAYINYHELMQFQADYYFCMCVLFLLIKKKSFLALFLLIFTLHYCPISLNIRLSVWVIELVVGNHLVLMLHLSCRWVLINCTLAYNNQHAKSISIIKPIVLVLALQSGRETELFNQPITFHGGSRYSLETKCMQNVNLIQYHRSFKD